MKRCSVILLARGMVMSLLAIGVAVSVVHADVPPGPNHLVMTDKKGTRHSLMILPADTGLTPTLPCPGKETCSLLKGQKRVPGTFTFNLRSVTAVQ